MTGASLNSSQELASECQALTKHLSDLSATPYVLQKYRAGHEAIHGASCKGISRFDEALLWLVGRGKLGAAMADSYSRWFARHSLVRYKVILMLAVLENSPGFHQRMTRARTGAFWSVLGRLSLAGVREVTVTAASVIVIGPIHAFCVITGRGR